MNLIRNASVLTIALLMSNPLQVNARQVATSDELPQSKSRSNEVSPVAVNDVPGYLTTRFDRHVESRTNISSTTGTIETAFSPDEAAEQLVIKAIKSAHKTIRLAAYSFTSPPVVRALVDAYKRGIDVQIVVDEKGNKSKASIAALNLVANAGISVRTNAVYAIHHDKYIIADGLNVQTGSFNYSKAAQQSNSENVIVIWNNVNVAASYLRHWTSRFNEGTPYQSSY